MKICVVAIYLGKLPDWIETYLKTCSYCENVNWKIFSDSYHENTKNVDFISTDYEDILNRIQNTGFDICKYNIRKICDMKLFYGLMFKEYLLEYDYWGIGDIDLFYGNVDKFINKDTFENYDIFTTRWFITGHGTFFKNNEKINNLFFQIPNIHENMKSPEYKGLDEGTFSKFVKGSLAKVKYNNIISSDGRFDKCAFSYIWKDGSIYHTKNEKEKFYVHFLNTKKTASSWDFCENSFLINRNGIFPAIDS